MSRYDPEPVPVITDPDPELTVDGAGCSERQMDLYLTWAGSQPAAEPGSGGRMTGTPQVGSTAWLAMEPDAYEKEAVAAFDHCKAQDAQIWAEPDLEAEAG